MQAIAVHASYTQDSYMGARRNISWLVAALLFGALLLPFLVYYTGVATLGPYSHGGPLGFYGGFLAGLARLHLSAWSLLLGPAALVLAWRLAARYLWPRQQ
jgi:hypothetical protein